MKYCFLLTALFFIIHSDMDAQIAATDKTVIPGDEILGQYQVDFYHDRKMNIKRSGKRIMLEIVGQGQAELILQSENKYIIKGVRPAILLEFRKDSLGKVRDFIFSQKFTDSEWNRKEDSPEKPDSAARQNSLSVYEGDYQAKGNAYMILHIKADKDHLNARIMNESIIELAPLSKNKFIYQKESYKTTYEFKPDEKGAFNKMIYSQSGPITVTKISLESDGPAVARHPYTERTGYYHADTLHGTLTPLRTSYDVLFYGLEVEIKPEKKSILGKTLIRMKAVNDLNDIQVDLFANMQIEKILFHDQALSYKRDADAVFIHFPEKIKAGTVSEITILYSGQPQLPDVSTLSGGFIWGQDKNGIRWFESVCQGSGASLWWPNKDHLSDKPDSMRISVTVPDGLTDVSNGQFLGKTDLPGNRTRFDWYVHSPINNYDVVVYVGDYIHIPAMHVNGKDTLQVNYYCLSFNEDKAKHFFQQVDPMLSLYEKLFGPYPFPKDGFALVESPYGMEHQSAVSMGAITNPANGNWVDTADLARTMWHESAHEWWGNSVTCKDYADFWIHEAFATYAESLCYEYLRSPQAGLNFLKGQIPENKYPVIGFYGVNDFHEGDMYPKGARMLNTLRHLTGDDTRWFEILKGLQKKFQYQTVTTEEIIQYFNKASGTDYTYFFDQYLRYPAIPELQLEFKQEKDLLTVKYKWKSDLKDFRMPVKVTTSNDRFDFIYPTTEWKTMQLPAMKSKQFKVDTDEFYINVSSNK